MPNRMLREGIVDSRKMAHVGDSAKVLFYKLMSVVDDFGRFEADPELLRRRLYMWETEDVSVMDVTNRLNDCANAGLIHLYSALGKRYLEILNFRQQIRAKSKCPDANGQYTPPPKDSKRSEMAQPVSLSTIDSNRNQLQANALVPTRLDSTRPGLNMNSSPEVRTAAIKLSYVEGTEGWDELIQHAARARMSLDPDPSSGLCQRVWRCLNREDKRTAIDGIRARIECGEYDPQRPQFTPTLDNYLNQKKWRNSLRPRKQDSPQKPKIAGALMRLVEEG